MEPFLRATGGRGLRPAAERDATGRRSGRDPWPVENGWVGPERKPTSGKAEQPPEVCGTVGRTPKRTIR